MPKVITFVVSDVLPTPNFNSLTFQIAHQVIAANRIDDIIPRGMEQEDSVLRSRNPFPCQRVLGQHFTVCLENR